MHFQESRRKLLAILLVSSLAGTLLAAYRVESQPSGSEWPMFRHDLMRTGFSPGITAPSSNSSFFSFSLPGPSAGLSLADGVLYIGGTATVYAFDVSSRAFLWNYTAGTGFFFSAPSVDGDTVYAGGSDGKLHALDRLTGTANWIFTTPREQGTSDKYMGPPAVSQGLVYVGSRAGVLFALNASSGAIVWEADLGARSVTAPAVHGGRVYAGSERGVLEARDAATGALVWSTPSGGGYLNFVAVHDGRVFYLVHYSMIAVNETTGAQLWQHPAYGQPAVAYGLVYFGHHTNWFYAVSQTTGQVVWSFLEGDRAGYPATVVDEKVFVGSKDRSLYAFNASNGALLWTLDAGYPAGDPVVEDGRLYYAAHNQTSATVFFLGTEGPPELQLEIVACGFSQPAGIDVNSQGDIYFTEDAGRSVKKIPAGSSTAQTIVSGSEYGHVDAAFDSNDNFWYPGYWSGNIFKLPAGSSSPQVFTTIGGQGPRGMDVDSADNLYVAWFNHQQILKIEPSTAITTLASGFQVGHVAVDSTGNVYFNSVDIYRIPAGTTTPQLFLSEPGGASRLYVDASDNLYYFRSSDLSLVRVPAGSSTPEDLLTIGAPVYGLAVKDNVAYMTFYSGGPYAGCVGKVVLGPPPPTPAPDLSLIEQLLHEILAFLNNTEFGLAEIKTEVSAIEAKLDPAGSFYTFVDNWFTTLQVAMGDAQTATLVAVDNSQSAIQQSISDAQGAILAEISALQNSLESQLNATWQEVISIEAKLDPGGSFYNFIDGWFTTLQASVADAQIFIASAISDSQAAIQTSISDAQGAILVEIGVLQSSLESRLNDTQQEVLSIEAKLDQGGTFHSFVDLWFTSIQAQISNLTADVGNLFAQIGNEIATLQQKIDTKVVKLDVEVLQLKTKEEYIVDVRLAGRGLAGINGTDVQVYVEGGIVDQTFVLWEEVGDGFYYLTLADRNLVKDAKTLHVGVTTLADGEELSGRGGTVIQDAK